MHTLWDLLWTNHGVGNFTASAVTFTAGLLVGRGWLHRHLVGPLHELHRKHDELHDKVDRLTDGST